MRKMSEAKYNTNLASEFYVLSALHRLGMQAMLTLGNKKSVDIVVVREEGDAVTVDVKGVAKKDPWPVDNVHESSERHFLVFVCFGGRIAEVDAAPEVWIGPSSELDSLIYKAPGGRRVVQHGWLKRDGERFKGAWHLLAGEGVAQPEGPGRPLGRNVP
jgi:hypothetical protein